MSFIRYICGCGQAHSIDIPCVKSLRDVHFDVQVTEGQNTRGEPHLKVLPKPPPKAEPVIEDTPDIPAEEVLETITPGDVDTSGEVLGGIIGDVTAGDN